MCKFEQWYRDAEHAVVQYRCEALGSAQYHVYIENNLYVIIAPYSVKEFDYMIYDTVGSIITFKS